MTFKEIQELIKQINRSNLTEFKLKDGEFEISIRTKEFVKSKSQIVQPTQQILPIQTTQAAAPMPAPPETEKEVATADSSNGTNEKAESIESTYIEVKSPIVGTFYRSPSPDKPPYIKVGDMVEEGDVVCIVEAMKLFNEIESEVSGRVVKVAIEDASPCEYDQILFVLDPNS